jgi:hypothetical protein
MFARLSQSGDASGDAWLQGAIEKEDSRAEEAVAL